MNKNSVQSEIGALKLLTEHGVVGIPQIVAEGIVDGIPYLVEYYIEGSSLDKIHHTLSRKNWEHIAHGLAIFLQELMAIQRQKLFFQRKMGFDGLGTAFDSWH